MKFEKLSMDKFNSQALSNDLLFNIVGGADTPTTYTGSDGSSGNDTMDGNKTKLTSGEHDGKTDTIIGQQ